MINKGIVERNLERMTKFGEGCMNSLILDKSMGGNAGRWQEHSCVAVNFYYNPESGEIVYFGNYQKVPQEIREKFLSGIFRIAINMRERGEYRIVTIRLGNRLKNQAKKNLEASVEEFNNRYGLKLKCLMIREMEK
ncbi:MAG: hypothetical protein QW625_03840 [Candidatus Nanoarchaeia archaeon]